MTKPPVSMSTTGPQVSVAESLERDRILPNNVGITLRMPKFMRVNVLHQARTENSSESAVIRRWIRNGAAIEGHDVHMW